VAKTLQGSCPGTLFPTWRAKAKEKPQPFLEETSGEFLNIHQERTTTETFTNHPAWERGTLTSYLALLSTLK
jgi:hypothetical protein